MFSKPDRPANRALLEIGFGKEFGEFFSVFELSGLEEVLEKDVGFAVDDFLSREDGAVSDGFGDMAFARALAVNFHKKIRPSRMSRFCGCTHLAEDWSQKSFIIEPHLSGGGSHCR
jgi:hypothetical protein